MVSKNTLLDRLIERLEAIVALLSAIRGHLAKRKRVR